VVKSNTLIKFLTESGLGSRRKMADAIRQDRVRVNRIVAVDFRQEINPNKDSVTLDGQPVGLVKTQTICLMLYKPAGIITTTSDEVGRKTVLDIIPPKLLTSRLYPIGRLDKDSTGLLLLTNDGNLTHQLTHPKFEHEKEYLVAIGGILKTDEKQKLEEGVELINGRTYPARVKVMRNTPPYNYSITIHEGRKRQVRRMFKKLGHPILALKRVRIGNLRLSDLKEGEVRKLSRNEVNDLLSDTQKPAG